MRGQYEYVAESSPDKRRNSLGSGLEIGTLSGYIAASIMIAVLTFFLNILTSGIIWLENPILTRFIPRIIWLIFTS